MVEHKHVIKHRVLPIIVAAVIIAVALAAAFLIYSSSGPVQTAESAYVEKLSPVLDMIRSADLQERQAVQDWKNSELTVDVAISIFTNLQAERLQIRANLKTIVAPEDLKEIHQEIVDANELWINANDNYVQGILQNDNGIIDVADLKAKNANQKFSSAIEKLRTLGIDV